MHIWIGVIATLSSHFAEKHFNHILLDRYVEIDCNNDFSSTYSVYIKINTSASIMKPQKAVLFADFSKETIFDVVLDTPVLLFL